MPFGLVPPKEEEAVFRKMVAYYKQIYTGVGFKRDEKDLDHKELGELLYTYPGEESEATAAEKMARISSAIGEGYDTPIIVLKAGRKMILLDGHRRVRVAYSQGMGWKALLIVPDKKMKFGMEDMVMGKVKDLYGR
ncbi:MAG: ParB N-terminal domain-containing protein [Candidatus Micrarchaeota archaeon]